MRRCPQCAAEIYETVDNCPLCQAELLGSFAINQDLIEESVENLVVLLRSVTMIRKSLRLAQDTDQLMARAKIREMVREDSTALTIFERGVVLQHLLNIVFNSRDSIIFSRPSGSSVIIESTPRSHALFQPSLLFTVQVFTVRPASSRSDSIRSNTVKIGIPSRCPN